MSQRQSHNPKKKTSKLKICSIFDGDDNSCKLWAKPSKEDSTALLLLSPFIAKSIFLKKGKIFGIWTERTFFLHRDYLYYKKVRKI